jgi:hypothetical protein
MEVTAKVIAQREAAILADGIVTDPSELLREGVVRVRRVYNGVAYDVEMELVGRVGNTLRTVTSAWPVGRQSKALASTMGCYREIRLPMDAEGGV